MKYLRSQFPSLGGEMKAEQSGDFIKQAAIIQDFLTVKYIPADGK